MPYLQRIRKSKYWSPNSKWTGSPNMQKTIHSLLTTPFTRDKYKLIIKQNTSDLYKATLKPLIPLLINQGVVTCFAYGQTGSGKTYTMNGMHQSLVKQLFELNKNKCAVTISFFEIYGGRCLDLLNGKNPLNILQDKANSIQIPGLTEI